MIQWHRMLTEDVVEHGFMSKDKSGYIRSVDGDTVSYWSYGIVQILHECVYIGNRI
jgi:hypothetical protein